ncbi:AfsR/SARP family transcriptional regulator [Kribbella monticola]|uniref:AfsR/SARP family transcriptional regulator n=1 Tax=Kribbella monticola TaxID=2185285 RepID=UPI0018E584A6|nr:BTAD domain-containing putative transcriptional regulator [Kribbella monticola]
MEFRVLGPVEAVEEGRQVVIPAVRVRTLLAVLLARAGRVVSVPEIVDGVWGESLPANPKPAVQNYIGRLRDFIGADLVRTRTNGYLITVEPADLVAFRSLVAAAGEATDPKAAADLLAQALGCWRGEPFADVDSESLRRHEVPRLIEERLAAVEQHHDALLALGQHAALVAPLTALTQEHPVRERFHGQLMTALYRSDRQADALAVYDDLAAALADELGIEPGPELRRIRQAVLTGELDRNPSSSGAAERGRSADGWSTVAQLPLKTAGFVGRGVLIDEAMGAVADGRRLLVVTGAPGVGKTSLGVRIAYLLAESFPDGQWFVRLRDTTAEDVLGALLRQSGVPAPAIPDGLDARSAALRSRLADRRVLLVLDDAADADHVRALLPGSGESVVLVTSRSSLHGLSLDGAYLIPLEVLPPDEAGGLLVQFLGPDLVRAEPVAASELIELCGSLPLALRIAAANLANRRGAPISAYVAELRKGNRLSKLAISGDPRNAVRAAFDLSYAGLRPAEQRLFRLLGLVPGADFTLPAATALAGDDSEDALEALVTANLVQRVSLERYIFHDLVRLYAAEQAADEPADAVQGLFDWYLSTADAAVQFGLRHGVQLPRPALQHQPFADGVEGKAWITSELENLVAVARVSPAHSWQLADVLRQYFVDDLRIGPWRAVTEAGLTAARQTGNVAAQGVLLQSLGILSHTVGEVETALEQWYEALDCYRRSRLPDAEPSLLSNLGVAHMIRDELDRAVAVLTEAQQATTNQVLSATILINLSYAHCLAGDLSAAVDAATACLEIAVANERQMLSARANRGTALHLLGDHQAAQDDLRQALPVANRQTAVGVRAELAHSLAATGELDEALAMAEEALELAGDNPWGKAEALIARGVVRSTAAGAASAVASGSAAGARPGSAVDDLVEARRLAELHGFPRFLAVVDRLLADRGHDIRQA